MLKHAILIAGPTASGKTALALQLSKEINGAIINADAMQVYRDLRILSARPTPEEEKSAPHFLFGEIDASENYSVARWIKDLSKVLLKLKDTQQTPILVGGTGLYFKSALLGISEIPQVPEAVRHEVRRRAAGKETKQLYEELTLLDPLTAEKLKPSDPQRILRALEVFIATGKPLISYQGPRATPALEGMSCAAFFLSPDRDALRKRINHRFDHMIAEGALDEVRALNARNLDPNLPCMRALGVPHLSAYLNAASSLAESIENGKGDTRRYTKRQFTFARHQLRQFSWLEPETAFETILARLSQRNSVCSNESSICD
ncbi:MAG: tRNA (adenosine(37)-N6)-dimethylallyltransferase MiaA [Methylocystis sp.]